MAYTPDPDLVEAETPFPRTREDPFGMGPLSAGTISADQIITGGLHQLDQGLKFDSGKTQIELFPPEAIFAISEVLTFGAGKYDERNWEKGMKWGRVFGATMRHLWAWWAGKGPTNTNFAFGDTDSETGFSHLWHAGCCIVFLITYEIRKSGTDDRFRASIST